MAETINKITIIPSVLYFVINICQSYLHVQNKFWVNGIYPIFMNIVIMFFLLNFKITPQVLAWSYNSSIILPSIMLMFIVYSYKLKLFKKGDFIKVKDSIKKTGIIFFPLFIGGMVPQLNEIIDRSFSLSYSKGVLTALRYGKLLEIVIVSVLGISICQAVYPKISFLFLKQNKTDVCKLISNILSLFIVIIIPIIILGLKLSKDMIQILFMRGNFNEESLRLTTISYICYSFSILPVCFSELLSRCFISLGQTKKIFYFSSIAMGTNIILNFLCIKVFKLEYYSLALTTSFSEILHGMLFYINIKKYNIDLKIKFRYLYSAIISSIMTYFLLEKLEQLIKFNIFISLILKIFIGIMIYGICIFLLNFNYIKKIYKRGKN